MFGHPTPILRSFDEQRAREFFVDYLEFEVEFEHRFHEGAPLYMGLRRGECRIHLSEHYGDGSPGAAMRIMVDDVIAFARSLREKRFDNADPGEPRLMDWGTRDITIQDPAGNRLCFYSEEPSGTSG